MAPAAAPEGAAAPAAAPEGAAAPAAAPEGVAAPSARQVVASWLALERAFDAARTLDERRAVAAHLPAEPAPAPEAHARQADLLLRAWALRPAPACLPPWRHVPLPGPSRLAWARLAVRVDPAGHRDLLDREPALWANALEGLDLLAAPDPRAVLAALAALDDSAADRALRRALPAAVARGLLAPPEARALLLARDDAWAWSELARPWACGLALPRADVRRALRGASAAEAVCAAAARGLWDDLRPLLEPPPGGGEAAAPDWAARRAAVEHAGLLGDGETVDALLAAGLAAPAELGGETLRALVALHRRGHFVRARHADAALALLAAGAALPADELAGLLFVARRAIVDRLPADVDDPLWLVLAPVLARWRLGPRPPAGPVEALLRLARGARRPAALDAALALLRDLAVGVPGLDPGPLEAAALARLDDAPAGALGLLEATAGEAARGELARRLGVDRFAAPDEALAPHAARALLVLWHATPPGERAALLDRLEPARLPEALASLVAARPPGRSARAVLELRGGADDPDAALLALCAVASPDDLPRIELGLLRSIEKALASPAASAPVWRGARHDAWAAGGAPAARVGEEAQQLPAPVAEALDALEARWKPHHRRPVWLLARGPRLRAELLLRAVEAGPARPAVLAAYLRSLRGLEHPRLPGVAARLLGHRDGDVAKLAARLLAQGGAAWLALELGRGAAAADDRRARACLRALANDGGPAAEAAALGALARPTMNLKKSAAEALAAVATPRSVPTLLHWLGRHDDPGLRASLGRALRTAAGPGALPALLGALDGAEGDERRQRLLVKELDGLVDVPLARALFGRAPGWARAFFEAVAEGAVRPRGADPSALAAELAASGLRPPGAPKAAPPRAPFDEAVDDLGRLGWDAERAAAALAHWPERLAAKHVATLRRELHRWLGAMVAWRDVRPAALLEAVLEAGPDAAEVAWSRAAAPALAALLGALAPESRAALWPSLERLAGRLDPLERLDLGAALRAALGATPGLAASPLSALARCGLVARRDDVERALAGVTGVPDPRAVRRAILAEAFGVAGAASAEPPDEEVRLRALVDEAARAGAEGIAARLDAMEALRPLGVDAWVWPAAPSPRARRRAERARPAVGPAARAGELEAWLAGKPPGPAPRPERLAEALPEEVTDLARDDAAVERLARFLAAQAGPELRLAYGPWLRAQARRAAGGTLTAVSAALARPFPPGPAPWSTPAGREHVRARWQALWTTTAPPGLPAPPPAEPAPGDREAWRRDAIGRDAEAARRALTRLAASPDGDWPTVLARATAHPSPRVRAHALRLMRRTLDRRTYLAAVRDFLRDDDPTVRRSAVRAVGHGGDAAALPELVARLLDPVRWVRDEALAAIGLYGEAGLAAIGRGMDRARPDDARRLARAADELRGGPKRGVTNRPGS